MDKIKIRNVVSDDFEGWCIAWDLYNKFYKRSVDQRVTERVWNSLISKNGNPYGFVADDGGNVIGFTHYFFVPSTSDFSPRCYMQDLFCLNENRGKGVGAALISAVYEAADKNDASQTYWLTSDDNTDARKLYDKIASKTSFIKYRR
jgi:GNAT superfamily N-acetyltransferase